ncbi:hypothetical protein [Serratia symbiotica]|uniref:hypothetical protein n=1 Tax=Serratia symbiotica TaxID=138074 RepID=UPI001B37C76B|nr:hypothetical protein [Serratia symbiotica]MBQ0956916.1 hypothetical protein [Serratia symbiotica]
MYTIALLNDAIFPIIVFSIIYQALCAKGCARYKENEALPINKARLTFLLENLFSKIINEITRNEAADPYIITLGKDDP